MDFWWKYLKVACWSSDCSTELLILVEVSVKVACRFTVTDCSHRAIAMQLIVVGVLVKVACRSRTTPTAAQSYLFWWKYL